MKIKKTQKNRAFTLIELMVATSIFVIIMLASMSSLFIMLDATKNSKALRSAMDNVNFAMESMTRSIRMGTNYYCGTAGQSVNLSDFSNSNSHDDVNCTLIAFETQDPSATQKVAYQLSGGAIQINNNNSWVPITSPDITINKLKFFVKGSGDNDGTQASVYIIIKGTVKVKGVPTSFAIQTMASQRNF